MKMRIKTTQIRGSWAVTMLAGLLASGIVNPKPSAAQTVERPIEEFLDAQGSFGSDTVPPVPDFLGSNDPENGLSMSVDYAGLADDNCDGIAGTSFDGTVTETPLPNGRALVSVELHTYNAITWVIDGGDFAADPVIFGTRWFDDGEGCAFDELPTLGSSELRATFIISEPGAPLPDMIALAIVALGLRHLFPDQISKHLELLTLDFEAHAIEELDDGTLVIAETKQVSEVVGHNWNFSIEKVECEGCQAP